MARCAPNASSDNPLSGSSSSFSSDFVPPPNAVSQGSFTVWANPAYPAPHQDYLLYTRVALPADTSSYTANDISGRLIGTDGFAINIGGARNPFGSFSFFPENHSAVITTKVPGAATAGIKDRIQVASRLLGESQTLLLVFTMPEK